MNHKNAPQRIALSFASAGLILASLAGCGSGNGPKVETGTVAGTISLNGQPLNSVTVCLTDVTSGVAALGNVSDEGAFVIKFNATEKVPCGLYKITVGETSQAVNPMDMMKHPEKYKSKNLVPKKYQTREATDLSVEVKPGSNELKLELSGK